MTRWHYTYVIHNEVSGRYYIGVRTSKCEPHADTKYWGSSRYLRTEREQAPEQWSKYVIETFPDRQHALAGEESAISGHLGNGLCINRSKGGNAWIEFAMSPEARHKISVGNKGKPKSKAHREAIAAARKTAKRPSLESRLLAGRNAGETRRGKPLSPEHRAAISAAQTGTTRVFTPEHRAALSAAAARRKAARNG